MLTSRKRYTSPNLVVFRYMRCWSHYLPQIQAFVNPSESVFQSCPVCRARLWSIVYANRKLIVKSGKLCKFVFNITKTFNLSSFTFLNILFSYHVATFVRELGFGCTEASDSNNTFCLFTIDFS